MKIIVLILFLASFSLQAKEISGINIPDNVAHSDQSGKLLLNGTGLRTKFIFDIYIGSLYLEKKTHDINEIYNLEGEKRISMHFLYDEVSKEKLVNGWNEGFENNLSGPELAKLKPRINQFNELFINVKKDDVINLNFIPKSETTVIINNKKMGTIDGDDFYAALLKIWLGDEPADSDLKQAMLGIANEE